jgi:hypothetical protein
MQGPGSTAIFPRILDRLLGDVIRIALKGESMRRRKSDEARLIPHRVAGVVENEWPLSLQTGGRIHENTHQVEEAKRTADYSSCQ